jgi:hypothetical protein
MRGSDGVTERDRDTTPQSVLLRESLVGVVHVTVEVVEVVRGRSSKVQVVDADNDSTPPKQSQQLALDVAGTTENRRDV